MGAMNRFLHVAHGLLHADEHRSRHDAVPDIQLLDAGNHRHRLDVLIIQTVS
jgi:hypothetical protein